MLTRTRYLSTVRLCSQHFTCCVLQLSCSARSDLRHTLGALRLWIVLRRQGGFVLLSSSVDGTFVERRLQSPFASWSAKWTKLFGRRIGRRPRENSAMVTNDCASVKTGEFKNARPHRCSSSKHHTPAKVVHSSGSRQQSYRVKIQVNSAE